MRKEDLLLNKEIINNDKMEPIRTVRGDKAVPNYSKDNVSKGVEYYLRLLEHESGTSLEGFTRLCSEMTIDEMTMVIESLGEVLKNDEKGHKFGK